MIRADCVRKSALNPELLSSPTSICNCSARKRQAERECEAIASLGILCAVNWIRTVFDLEHSSIVRLIAAYAPDESSAQSFQDDNECGPNADNTLSRNNDTKI